MAYDEDDEELEEDEEELELVMFKGATNGADPNLRKNTRLVEAGLLPAKKLISDALARRADSIVVEPKGGGALVKLEVDGIPYPGARLRKQSALAITQVLKLLAGLEVKERQRPQRGGIKAEYEGLDYEINIATEPVAGGAERLRVRSRGGTVELDKPEQLGMSAEMKTKISELADKRGLVLACGPPSSGLTTTALSGVLRSIDVYVYSIVTIADMQGREIVNIPQFEPDEGDTVDQTLMRIIRAENDVVFVDPIRDPDALKTYAKRAEDITIVGEFAARDTAFGLAQLVEWGGADLVCDRVRGVVTQKLIRRLCEKCKFAYRPHPKLLAKIGLPKEVRVLYKPQPPPDEEDDEEPDVCRKCGGLNYFGRIGMYELLEVTDPVKEAIRAGADPAAIRKAARDDGQRGLQQDGLRLVQEGITSFEELQRVFRAPAKKGGPKRKKKKRRRPE